MDSLLPTKELIHRGILDRKGFPESYDMEALVHFLLEVKTGIQAWMRRCIRIKIYDIVPGGADGGVADILIVEGD